MQRLVQAIDAAARQGKFQKRPIGPIGAHLSLTDERWAVAVDAAIGGSFGNFLVHSGHDLTVLTVRTLFLPLHPLLSAYLWTIRGADGLPDLKAWSKGQWCKGSQGLK